MLGQALADEEQILAARSTTAAEAGPSPSSRPRTRPAWVNAPPQLVGDAYQMSIAVGPYTTRAECDAKLPEALQEALGHYVDVCLGDQAVDDIRLPADYLRQQLVKAQWEETRQLSVGPMIWLHVLLQFDRKIKDRILEEHRQAIIGQRLHAAATWSAIGLALLTVAFGYLKIDLATGGVYRGRLRLAAAAAILGLVASRGGLYDRGHGSGLGVRIEVRGHQWARNDNCARYLSTNPDLIAPTPILMSAPPQADTLLIRRIREGDGEAWSELIGRFEGRLLAYVESRTRNRTAAEDLVQETFIGFLTSLPNFDPRRPLEGYLFSIAAHKLTDYLRREGRRPTLPLVTARSDTSGWEPVGAARPASSIARSGERRRLEEAALVTALGQQIEHFRRHGQWERLECVELLSCADGPTRRSRQN